MAALSILAIGTMPTQGAAPAPWMALPFVLLLAGIAIMPFAAKHWWEQHYPKVAVGLGALTVLFYVLLVKEPARMVHTGFEFVSFILLIGSLFVISGGIHIRVKGESTPAMNCVFLLIGAVLANLVGTTGASMLLIRPWIRMNQYRVTGYHIVFFIFIVSNVGGCLTPIGDPPLFLGYLKGVPFWWMLERCFQGWLVGVGLILAIFAVIDTLNFRKAPRQVRELQTREETWRFDGAHNLLWLGLVLFAVFLKPGLREALMVVASVGAYLTTPPSIRHSNGFHFGPIKEVAWLFAGIFATMVPALHYLELHANELGMNTEMQFFWITGTLSSVLDNAPTYLALLAAAMGSSGLSLDNPADVQTFIATRGGYLTAISLGAVFFGAMTYIGNGPNFMVKALAEQARVRVPGFFGYLLKYSLPVLVPVFVVIGLLFFHPRGAV